MELGSYPVPSVGADVGLFFLVGLRRPWYAGGLSIGERVFDPVAAVDEFESRIPR